MVALFKSKANRFSESRQEKKQKRKHNRKHKSKKRQFYFDKDQMEKIKLIYDSKFPDYFY